MSGAFFDSNVLVYVFSDDPRAGRARELMEQGGAIGVQTLNELTNVLRRKQRFEWDEVEAALAAVRHYCSAPRPLDDVIHLRGLDLARRHRLAVYDGMIIAAALTAGCDTLYSEDMHAGLVIDDRLTIVNPFA